ncbi:MAG: hypothetical protein JNL39_04240 [Opitutaceae bacterium]|nr:hypothetical protein [Opitutaceae bacterium]
MNDSPFLRIERDTSDGARHFVVHTADPRLAVEFAADTAAPDRVGRGVIRRVCVPNSWAGDYGRYAKLLAKAQEFFAASSAEPAPKAETRRLAR